MKYVANPVEVTAYPIVGISPIRADGAFELTIADRGSEAQHVVATKEMVSRMTPKLDDYWVIQSDGYIYLNPKEVFERKYSPKQEAASASQ